MKTEESEMELLLKERGSAQHSIQMADSYIEFSFVFFFYLISQASESHSMLVNQRNRLSTNRSRISTITTRFPIMNKLMDSIKDRRNRDKYDYYLAFIINSIIVAFVIALCIFFCIWYVSPRR